MYPLFPEIIDVWELVSCCRENEGWLGKVMDGVIIEGRPPKMMDRLLISSIWDYFKNNAKYYQDF